MSFGSTLYGNKSHLKSKLIDYWRWVTEGKKKYREKQWIYDPYHEYIEYLPDKDEYRFDIQVFDSPEGDIWWKGTFRVKPNNDIDIVEQHKIYR